jgi:hypothetical protein
LAGAHAEAAVQPQPGPCTGEHMASVLFTPDGKQPIGAVCALSLSLENG